MGIAIPFHFAFVSRRHIDADDVTFCASFTHPEEKLQQSLERSGMLQPLCLWPRAGRFAIIDGFRRLWAAQRLDLSPLPACIVDTDAVEPLACFVATLEANLVSRGLNVVEQACGVRKLAEDFGMPEEKLVSTMLPRLGYASSKVELQKLIRLATAERQLQRHIVNGRVSATFAFQLAALTPNEQRAVVQLFSELPCSLGKQRDMVTLFDELARRERSTVKDLIEATRQVWQAAEGSHDAPERLRSLRRHLAARRFPLYHQVEDTWNSTRRRLGLPPKITLSHAAYFEGDQLTVSFNFRHPQELRTYAEKLLEAAAKPELAELFDHV